MKFSDIPGLSEVKELLCATVTRRQVPHAQLFFGKAGSATLPLALAFARYLHCTNRSQTDSCGVCPSCHKYNKWIHPDLHFIFPTATNKKFTKSTEAISQNFLQDWRVFLKEQPWAALPDWSNFIGTENKQCLISKEESRNIIRSLSLKAFEGEYKIMMIWLPELMHPSAANAILKILEEPPAGTIFLLVSHSSEKLLTTILSRTQLRQIRQFTDHEIAGYLQQTFRLDSEKAAYLAYLAEGDLGAAIRQVGEVSHEAPRFFQEWMRVCFRSDFTSMLGFAETFQKLPKEEQKAVLQYGLGILRESLLIKYAGRQLLRLQQDELKFVGNFSKVLDEATIDLLSGYFTESIAFIERNANAKILFASLSVKLSKQFKK